MKGEPSPYSSRLSGGQALIVAKRPPEGVDLDSFFGPFRVEWDHEAPMTPLGQAPFFVHFLKTAGLFDALVIDFPLRYMRPNAPSKRDFLGTAMLSTLAGRKRYVHIAALRCDAVPPELLGMRKIVREDAIQRAFQGGRRDARGGLAASAPAILCGAAAGRTVDPRERVRNGARLKTGYGRRALPQ